MKYLLLIKNFFILSFRILFTPYFPGSINKIKIILKYLFLSFRNCFYKKEQGGISLKNISDISNTLVNKNAISTSTWNFFNFLIIYQLKFINVKDYLRTPIALHAYNSSNVDYGYKLSDKSIFNNYLLSFSKKIHESFNNVADVNNTVNLLSHYAGSFTISSVNIENLLKDHNIIEFGGGSGINALLNYHVCNKNICLYDLPPMTILQKKIHQNFFKHNEDRSNLNRISYEDNLINVEKFAKKNKYGFISYFAFSEAPITLRDNFFNILHNASFIIIASNTNFENIDNISYFNSLQKKLNENFSYQIIDFPDRYKKWKPVHKYHIFTRKI
tara:strand:+ start:774 stop:1763 length:990 start_codon:yes stop_codon:yes gene_type:complete